MDVITTLEEMEARVGACNDALTHDGDDAMRALFGTFRLDMSAQFPADPFSPAYREAQLSLHARLTGKPYAVANERTLFDVAAYRHRPYPYYLGSTQTAGQHYQAIGNLLRALEVPPGGRVVEFGPGWGNSTLVMARLGLAVTAVDIEPNFCQVLRERAAQDHVDLQVVQGDFFWAETVTDPYDAAVFFECFHHCDDHMRLLRALHTAVKPGGIVVFASEPILPDYFVPWGVRTDGMALWAMRNFAWLELGFREAYFHAALARTGWRAVKHPCADPDWASVWVARAVAPDPDAQEQRPAPPAPPAAPGPGEAEAALATELQSVYASTSWRVTAPMRALRRRLARKEGT